MNMRRKHILPMTAILLSGIILGSCSENDEKLSKSPVYKDITLTPNQVYTGQKVNALVSYTDPGAYIQSCDYQYTLSDGTSYSWKQISPTETQPEFEFYAPLRAGRYTVTFNATRVRFSANGPQGTIFGSTNAVKKDLVVMASDVINANWGDKKDELLNKIDVSDSSSLLVWTGDVILKDESASTMAKDTLTATRTYHFDNGGLTRVEQTVYQQLTSKSNYNTAMEQYVLDSLVNNYKATIDVMGLTNIDILRDYAIETENDISLIGSAANDYKVSDWNNYTGKKKAELVRAFWRGEIERYEVVMYSERTKCVASIYMDISPNTNNKDRMVIKWIFTSI